MKIGDVVNLIMDIVYKMKFYQPSATEEIRMRFWENQNDPALLISHAFWVLDNNIKNVIENEKHAYIREQFPNWKEETEAAAKKLHEWQNACVLTISSTHTKDISQLQTSVNSLNEQIEKLQKQVEKLSETVAILEQEKKIKEEKKHFSRFSFLK